MHKIPPLSLNLSQYQDHFYSADKQSAFNPRFEVKYKHIPQESAWKSRKAALVKVKIYLLRPLNDFVFSLGSAGFLAFNTISKNCGWNVLKTTAIALSCLLGLSIAVASASLASLVKNYCYDFPLFAWRFISSSHPFNLQEPSQCSDWLWNSQKEENFSYWDLIEKINHKIVDILGGRF